MYNDIISSPVQFFVTRNTNWGTLNTPIQFQIERLNIGNAMNLGTGKFTATKAGTYYFAFSGQKTNIGTDTIVNLRLNNNNVGTAPMHSSSFFTASIHATLKLKLGDEITLVLISGVLQEFKDEYLTQFTGMLLEEDLVIS